MGRAHNIQTVSPVERIIFPLDVPSGEEAVRLVGILKNHVGVYKIGLELFVKEGPSIIEAVRKESPSSKIFLDMKFHDIPETVKRAERSAVSLGVDFITVHCEGGAELLRAAAKEAGNTVILGVTVLTSSSREDLLAMGMREELADPEKLVLHKAKMAKDAGLGGVVCSGLEVKKVKQAFGSSLITVTPGIRFADVNVASDDQKRIVTPFDAIRDGADYIVVGRPIRDAKDPIEAADKVKTEIAKALA
ncbi:MAG: orotidine-5'-phosphate decarboxylase [Deltaproteobacteria bacterium]|nr:orotidine-5'-phosphate decarboxylase [Deltaproteobacteria bacterium]